jgi:hypothetical protein
MPVKSNPAGRLRDLLLSYRKAARKDQTARETWSDVLSVHPDQVDFELIRVGGLVLDIDRVVAQLGDVDQQEVVAHNRLAWMRPVFPANHSLDHTPSPGPEIVDRGALTALGGLSSFLSVMEPARDVPDESSIQNLRERTSDALEAVRQAEDLHAEVRRALVRNLHAVLEALDHLHIGGPQAVAEALKRLACDVRDESEETKAHPAVEKALRVAGHVWAAFTKGSVIASALDGWTRLLGSGE